MGLQRARFPGFVAPASLLLMACATGCGGAHRPVERVPARPVDADAVEVRPGVEAPAERPGRVASIEGDGVDHIVERGQTLWRIARTYGLSVDELARANDIDDPRVLEAGEHLFIPRATARLEVPPLTATPVVSAGDWLWPVHGGTVISYFGANRRTHRHSGVDIGSRSGERVLASRDGVVVYAGATMRGYGKTVILDHGDGLRTLYAHNSKLLVRDGERVRKGQSIARVGQTGNASTDHCHFEIRKNDVAQDPMRYVDPTSGARR